ncbi:MAG: peptidoglycan editing factor PgeF [Sideroxyarcus sp.]
MGLRESLIYPDWPAPANVKALQTTRHGGISTAPYDTLNLGLHVGDDPVRVNRNRQMLEPLMPSEPVWLEQVHGTVVADADAAACRVQADACIARQRGSVCVIMTADCLPVLLCDEAGTVVGAAHAGWRGLCDGVIEATVKEMGVAPQQLMAWLGPTIGPHAFEVGEDVRAAFMAHDAQAAAAFIPLAAEGKYRADIVRLARQRLNALGITRISGGTFCTYHQKDKFFSYRRDGVTGRMGTFIWLG